MSGSASFNAAEDSGIESGIRAAACDLFVLLGTATYFRVAKFDDLETARRHKRPILAFVQPGIVPPAGLLDPPARVLEFDFTSRPMSELMRAVHDELDRMREDTAH